MCADLLKRQCDLRRIFTISRMWRELSQIAIDQKTREERLSVSVLFQDLYAAKFRDNHEQS